MTTVRHYFVHGTRLVPAVNFVQRKELYLHATHIAMTISAETIHCVQTVNFVEYPRTNVVTLIASVPIIPKGCGLLNFRRLAKIKKIAAAV